MAHSDLARAYARPQDARSLASFPFKRELRVNRTVLPSLGRSKLEAIIPVPLKKARMRLLKKPGWHNRSACLVDQTPNALRVVRLPRYQDIQIIRKADEATIEHPMRRTGQRDTIS